MDAILKASLPKLREKLLEALQAVLPIVAIVLVLCFTIAPVSPSILLCFLLGAVLIVVGIMFFTLGAEMSMTPMGERVGAVLTRSRKLPVILGVGFLLGFLITISEPDLQVLANQVPSIPNQTLIFSVAAGVGLFLVFAFLRMLIGISLPKLLVLFYGMIFLLAAFVPKEFLAVAFDSGGVTTGPITVPFIMALGVGVSAIRSDRHAADDSFGLVALSSIGPVLAVMILPSIINVSETALRAVPREYEDASLALGATPIETYFKVSVPAAKSGIAAAVVLGVGRAIGEAMAVMMVSGNAPNMPSLFQSVRFLTTAVASEMSYSGGLQRQALFSIALVLFLFIMLINATLNFFLKRNKEGDK